MAFTIATPATALAAGFSLYPGSQKCFVHSRAPGFLFRIVASIEEAVMGGGILLVGPQYLQAYLGLDATAIVAANKVGRISVPSAVKLLIRKSTFGAYAYAPNTSNPVTMIYGTEAQIVAHTELVLHSDGIMLGVVSAADRGYFHAPLVGSPTARAWSLTCSTDVVSTQNTNYPGINAVLQDHSAVLPHYLGYLYKAWTFKAKAYMSATRKAFAANLASEDVAVVEKYLEAYDAEMAGLSDTAILRDGLFLSAYRVAGALQWGVGVYDAPMGYVPYGTGGDAFRDVGPRLATSAEVAAAGANTSSAKNRTVITRAGFRVLPSGVLAVPCVHSAAGHVRTGIADRVTCMNLATGTASVLSSTDLSFTPPDRTFDLNGLTFTKVKLSGDQTLPVSSVLAFTGPITKPSILPPVPGQDVLDATDRFRDGVRWNTPDTVRPSGAVTTPRLDTDANFLSDQVLANGSLGDREDAEISLSRCQHGLGKFATEMTVRLDQRVRLGAPTAVLTVLNDVL